MNNIKNLFISRVKERLEQLEIPQSELAKRLGIKPSNISIYLKSDGPVPSIEMVAKIARALNLDTGELIGEPSESARLSENNIIDREKRAATNAEIALISGLIKLTSLSEETKKAVIEALSPQPKGPKKIQINRELQDLLLEAQAAMRTNSKLKSENEALKKQLELLKSNKKNRQTLA